MKQKFPVSQSIFWFGGQVLQNIMQLHINQNLYAYLIGLLGLLIENKVSLVKRNAFRKSLY